MGVEITSKRKKCKMNLSLSVLRVTLKKKKGLEMNMLRIHTHL